MKQLPSVEAGKQHKFFLSSNFRPLNGAVPFFRSVNLLWTSLRLGPHFAAGPPPPPPSVEFFFIWNLFESPQQWRRFIARFFSFRNENDNKFAAESIIMFSLNLIIIYDSLSSLIYIFFKKSKFPTNFKLKMASHEKMSRNVLVAKRSDSSTFLLL